MSGQPRPPPPKPPVVQPGTGNNIIIGPNQRGNPVLEQIKNVGKEFGDIVVDFQVGRTTGVLYLSLRYHRLHPEYIHTRIEKLGYAYNLRILLILCDVTEHKDIIRELTKTCHINNVTIIVAFTLEEAGHYLATFKQFEHKPPDMIKERVDKDYPSILRSALTSINRVNKTDVETLRTTFGSFANIAKTSSDQLQNLPGFGPVKVRNIKNAFDKPFRNNATTALSFSERQSARASQAQKDDVSARVQASSSRVAGPSTSKAPSRPAPRQPSPTTWDIDIGADDITSPTAETGPLPETARRRPPSPAWNIELDLNDSD
ncbi:hypothetical protein HGRIS_002670 [Hohenbuehelia grisea]|uniref:ERCC1-like central domain-containing protein n=1 Tax=Hohenbuehelia grisea TaxID=104357 RepID=A0ABR3JLP6_9AGAR